MSTCILVLGTPRSGTSCVAGVLHHLGVPMGDNLMPADDGNPVGYFHDADIEIAIDGGELKWEFPTWTTSRRLSTDNSVKALNAYVARRATVPLWGVKSNRVIHYLDAFIKAVGDIKIIRTRRPLNRSIQSWYRFCGWEDDNEPITRTLFAIERGLTQLGITPDLVIDYDDLVDNTERNVEAIASLIGVPVTPEALAFVTPEHRRIIDG